MTGYFVVSAGSLSMGLPIAHIAEKTFFFKDEEVTKIQFSARVFHGGVV
jgi:hypothetical protein